ncbi:DNA polymerase III subunit epsilon [Acetobacteraceae bacterium ESL0709]|nr:DNA polymerase III subunit epsilon [Acetobacteraceae bacterium ESL0697]MDF7678259.1 DNA polymerase III subunit epsilon [Acetobacteraceae bacterium ESL0709]
MVRSILFDTETTGLDPEQGDRVIEIAALELENDLRTDRYFHVLIDPERDIPPEATRVHGFTREDLLGKPRFADIADEFLAFIGDDKMIAHNAKFDFGFINAELRRCGREPLDYQGRAIDTVAMARRKFPGMPVSLDALCRRFGIDLSERGTHNALLDCRLLAEVYVELMGGRQRGLGLSGSERQENTGGRVSVERPRYDRKPRPMVQPEGEVLARWVAFTKTLDNPLWVQEG